jgi:putative tryptophan/tyrosine transport system substrate-binding protein
MRRREFITLLGGAAVAWPFAARAQQSALPVVGFLNATSLDGYRPMVNAFRQGLEESGYVDGRNIAIQYRWAEGRVERLPAMAADLVRRQVTVIAATTTPGALAAKAATTTIPVVFEIGGDPVRLGLVASFDRPGGNVTGVTNLNAEVAPKRLELLHELIPTGSGPVALLVNPIDRVIAEIGLRASQAAARALGLNLHVLNASTESDFDGVFANLVQMRAGGLVIGSHAFFLAHSEQLGALSLRHAVPTVHESRRFVAAGGLVGYGGSITDAYRLAGVYTARVLKGEKPADLPIQQGTKLELYINLKTAKALGITVPLPLSGRADELIE